MKQKGFSFSLPVTVVVTAIAFVYFVTVFVFIDRWFGLMTSPGIMNAVVFTCIAVMCVLNYVFAIFMDPGRDIEDSKVAIHEIKRKGGDLRYCQKCSHFKPPRAHHCRVCKICILRMDHHCIWINNCVGHANYKVFFVFVVYAVIACIYSMVLLVGSLTSDSENDERQSEDSFRIIYAISMIYLPCRTRTFHICGMLMALYFQVISGLLLVPLSVALSVLLGWHIYLILLNETTIEYYEGVRAMWLEDKEGDVYKHPYDLGAYKNLIMVLGPRIICWICPASKHIGNGLSFRTAYDGIPAVSTSE